MWTKVWTQPRTRRRILVTSAIIWLPPLLLRPLGTSRGAWLVYLGLVLGALALSAWTTALADRGDDPPPPLPSPPAPPPPAPASPPPPTRPRAAGPAPRRGRRRPR